MMRLKKIIVLYKTLRSDKSIQWCRALVVMKVLMQCPSLTESILWPVKRNSDNSLQKYLNRSSDEPLLPSVIIAVRAKPIIFWIVDRVLLSKSGWSWSMLQLASVSSEIMFVIPSQRPTYSFLQYSFFFFLRNHFYWVDLCAYQSGVYGASQGAEG